jgi:xanthine dehydrogenase accessory factor
MRDNLILIRGGGDLASGVASRLHRAGFNIVITELPRPQAVRRTVAFSEAVYEGQVGIEGITARLAKADQILPFLEKNDIPVLIDPDASVLVDPRFRLPNSRFTTVVDARLLKTPAEPLQLLVPLYIGLGPGFHAGHDCQAVIETRRGHTLGRVYWSGTSSPDSGQADGDPRRVLRAPREGMVIAHANIGDLLEEGQWVAEIRASTSDNGHAGQDHSKSNTSQSIILSPFKGVLRGLIRPGIHVKSGMKVGDVDPRQDPSFCYLISDKALAVGGGVLEAILTHMHKRE